MIFLLSSVLFINCSSNKIGKKEIQYFKCISMFRKGYSEIYKNENSILGLKDNGKFNRVILVFNYFSYVIIEAGIA
jgi:hypothetical protein